MQPGDTLLLCSDGLTSTVPEHRLASAIKENSDPATCASWLTERAIAAGSTDNITVVIIRVDRSPHQPLELTLW